MPELRRHTGADEDTQEQLAEFAEVRPLSAFDRRMKVTGETEDEVQAAFAKYGDAALSAFEEADDITEEGDNNGN